MHSVSLLLLIPITFSRLQGAGADFTFLTVVLSMGLSAFTCVIFAYECETMNEWSTFSLSISGFSRLSD